MLSEYTYKGRCTINVRNNWKLWKAIQSSRMVHVVFFEKLDAEEGKKVSFDKVVLVSDDKKVEVGAPYVKGVKVEGKVLANGKGKKIVIYRYKAKKNERRTQGHRQPFTKVEITSIKVAAEKKAETK